MFLSNNKDLLGVIPMIRLISSQASLKLRVEI